MTKINRRVFLVSGAFAVADAAGKLSGNTGIVKGIVDLLPSDKPPDLKGLSIELKTQLHVDDRFRCSSDIYIPIAYQKGLLVTEYVGSLRRARPSIGRAVYHKLRRISDRGLDILNRTEGKNLAIFYSERNLDHLIDTNIKKTEWLQKKVKEIVGNSISEREITDKLFKFVANEVDECYVPKSEIKRFKEFLSKEDLSSEFTILNSIEKYFPYLKNRIIENIEKDNTDVQKDRLEFVNNNFDTGIARLLKRYRLDRLPFVHNLDYLPASFLNYVGENWPLFKVYMTEPEKLYDAQHIIENGGVCDRKSACFKTLSTIAGVPCIRIGGYDPYGDQHHDYNAVKVDGNWEIDDIAWGKIQIKAPTHVVKVELRKTKGNSIKEAYFIPIINSDVSK